MLRLAFSNRVRALAERLVSRVEESRRLLGPFEPIEVVVPHGATAAFLKMELAASRGIAANLRFSFLQAFLHRLLQPAAGASLKVARRESVELLLLELLARPEQEPELAAVGRYLDAAGEDQQAREARCSQLARTLARVFEHYLIFRPELARAWLAGAGSGSEDTETEAWQRALFVRLFGKEGPLERGAPLGAKPLLLHDALERLPLSALALPQVVHLFAPQHLAPPELRALGRIAERCEVLVYALNPSREFWDDVEAPGEAPLLRAWGRTGRESVRHLLELSGFDFEACYTDPLATGGLSALKAVQHDLYLRRGESEPQRERPVSAGKDPSVQVLACPGVRRELEVIAQEIWALVSAGHTAFHQIAVVLPEREEQSYRAQLAAVFAEHASLPHHFLDVPVVTASRVSEAIELLLALPFSAFGRGDLLRLLLHPAVLRRMPGVDPQEWLRWIDELAIVHGADRSDHHGTYIEKDLYNWDQGMRRLMLGAFMSGEKSGELRPYQSGADQYLPLELSLDRLGSASRLYTLVRSLIADARFCRAQRLPLAEWVELIRLMLTSYLGAPDEAPAAESPEAAAHAEQDERDLHRCLDALLELGTRDLAGGPIPFRAAADMVREALAGLRKNQGQPLADGVAVGPLSALAALPFRVVFVTGLGEGRFPAVESHEQLDLGAHKRRPGDLRAREMDLWRFLLRLSATEERLYLSYVSRDAHTGDPLEPSSVILELLAVLERESGVAAGQWITAHPLRRWELSSAPQAGLRPRPVREELRARALRASALEALRRQGYEPAGAELELPILLRVLPPAERERLAAELGLTLPPERRPGREGTLEISASALRRFLEDPRKGWMRIALGMDELEEEDDPFARESESFAASPLETAILLRAVLAEKLLSERPFAELYDERAAFLELKGVLPTGVFRAADRERHLEILRGWEQGLSAALGKVPCRPPLVFGRGPEHLAMGERSGALCPPITLTVPLPDGALQRVEIYGRTELMAQPSTSITAVAGPPSEVKREERALRGFLDHLCLSALDRPAAQGHGALVLFLDGAVHKVHLAPLAPEQARAYLEALVQEILARPHPVSLPFEQVLRAHTQQRADGELQAILERRFALFFRHRGLEGR